MQLLESTGPFRTPTALTIAAVACAGALAACGRSLSLPDKPAVIESPVITALKPRAAFANDLILIEGHGFDPVAQNNAVRFEEGLVTAPEEGSDSEHLWVRVPIQAARGSLLVTNRFASSNPSPEYFQPLGFGHPILGTDVGEVRFRHRPVGLVDTPAIILVASSLFDATLDDSGRFNWVTGKPVALQRMSQGAGALLATRAPDGGRVMEVDTGDGRKKSESAPSRIVERFLLPLPAPETALARTIGFDETGAVKLSTWTRSGAALVANTVPLAVTDVLGATQRGGQTLLVAVLPIDGHPETALVEVSTAGAVTVRWRPGPLGLPAMPSGAITLVDAPAGVQAIVALGDGDLAIVDVAAGTWRRNRMVSFAPAEGLLPAARAGSVLVLKSLDQALFQLNVTTGTVEWSQRLPGTPTVMDIEPSLGEIIIANADTNTLDAVATADGTWLGESRLSLGLGSVDGGSGGVMAPYSYDPKYAALPNVMQVLARTAPMVIDLDPATLDILGAHEFAPGASEPLRLVKAVDLRTIVVHRTELGMLEPGAGTKEHLIISNLAAEPRFIGGLRDGRLVVGTDRAIDVYTVKGEGASTRLERAGGVALPAGVTLVGLISHVDRPGSYPAIGDGGEDQVLAVWQDAAGVGGAIYEPAALLAGTAPAVSLSIPSTTRGLLGVVDLFDGPALLFARSAVGAVLLTNAALRGAGAPLPSGIDHGEVTMATIDGRYLLWLDNGFGENRLRVMSYDPGAGVSTWSGYTVPAITAGADTDPSGEWIYAPIPALDLLKVVQ